MELFVNLGMVLLALWFVLLVTISFSSVLTKDYDSLSGVINFCRGVLSLPYNLLPLDLIIKNLRGR